MVLLGSSTLHAQTPSPAAQAATQALLQRASTLEGRGRLDLASQTWQQVLLTDPNNTEALGGLARAAKLSGNAQLANTYLNRLRAINPHDPNIARIQSMQTQQSQSAQLAQAGKYAAAGQYKLAMDIYRQLFGNEPPPGAWAIAYYETESATEEGRPHAIAGLRSLIHSYPNDSRYQIALGRILTYTPRTRAEGRSLLARYPNDPPAAEAFRQSLLWDAQNPAAAADIRAYLAQHNDIQLSNAFNNAPKGGAPMTAAEKRAYARDHALDIQLDAAFHALNGKHIPEAEQRFQTILVTSPSNPRALAGMGYVRMQQSNFTAAISFLEQAKQEGARDPGLEAALSGARFYSTMAQGAAALDENDLPTAEKQYQAALMMRSANPLALEGLGGTLLKAREPVAAVEVFERYTKVDAAAPMAWRGLFIAQYEAGYLPQALQTEQRIPSVVHIKLMRDPEYLRTLALVYTAAGRNADAQRVLVYALDLPFPTDGHGLKAETQIEYADLLEQANRPEQAASLYRQALKTEPNNAGAWQGLIRMEHALAQDPQALQTLESMPAPLREQALRDFGFDATVAAIYQSQRHLDLAQAVLERAIAQQISLGQRPNLGIETQLAGIYLAENNAGLAFPIYHQVLAENPSNLDAWKGLLNAFHTSSRDRDALAEIRRMPNDTRRTLENDVDYLQTVANIYNALGEPRQASVYLIRVQQHYSLLHSNAPADIDIQSAYLYFNGANDPALYKQLMALGTRNDLTDEQRRTVQTIWALWAVRRANQSSAAGDDNRALTILNAAAHAFPDNPGVLKALAGGYARAGQPKEAIAIFKTQELTSAADYQSAIGAALSSDDKSDAEIWLRFGLNQYPTNPQLLILGAKFEQARGDYNRAVTYYHASLSAMPAGNSGSQLAWELRRPGPTPPRLPSNARLQGLASLLSPSAANTPAANSNQPDAIPEPGHPYLPSYTGTEGTAPIDPNSAAPAGMNPIVPPYMANPVKPTPNPNGTLKDYVPQSRLEQPMGGYAVPQVDSVPILQPAVYQRRQIRQLTEQAEAAGLPSTYLVEASYHPQRLGPGPLSDQPAQPRQPDQTTELAQAEPPPQQGTLASPGNPNVVYGTYVPYVPPATQTQPAQSTYVPQAKPRRSSHSKPSTADSYGQQYPQPKVPPTRQHPAYTPQQGISSPAPALAQQPATLTPQQPALSYPSVTQSQQLESTPPPQLGPVIPVDTPPTDAELVARSVPALRGGSPKTVGPPLTEREQAQLDLAQLDASLSSWMGGTPYARHRSGTPGFDRLTDFESPLEASLVADRSVRITAVAIPIYMTNGTIDTATLKASTGVIPILGTLPGNATVTPNQQFANGVAGELQLATNNFGISGGYSADQFLVRNITGHIRWRPLGGHITLFGDRDSVKETQLSYAGLRDPGTTTSTYAGNIWGGVVSTGGGARIDIGNEHAGFYLSADGANLTGHHVLTNRKFEGTTGAYFRVKAWPGVGSLNVGGTFFGMHYTTSELGMTYGSGGYFSPQGFFIAAVPVTFNGHYKTAFHYTVGGSIGLESFQSDFAHYYPLDPLLEAAASGEGYASTGSTGVNYSVNAQASYHIADHWYAGGFLTGNNSNDYDSISGGFFIRYLIRDQFPTEDTPTGLFPVEGLRPMRVP